MTQKPVLRAEVGMRVRCANKASAECIMRGRGIGQNSRTLALTWVCISSSSSSPTGKKKEKKLMMYDVSKDTRHQADIYEAFFIDEAISVEIKS